MARSETSTVQRVQIRSLRVSACEQGVDRQSQSEGFTGVHVCELLISLPWVTNETTLHLNTSGFVVADVSVTSPLRVCFYFPQNYENLLSFNFETDNNSSTWLLNSIRIFEGR